LPDAGFDKRRVFGRVLSLMKLKDMRYAKALEFVAGAKLHFVVVDNESTSKLLLDRDCFSQRETCVPNSKIVYHDYDPRVFLEPSEGRRSAALRRRSLGR
jgi:structural maintenance of chromosome 2